MDHVPHNNNNNDSNNDRLLLWLRSFVQHIPADILSIKHCILMASKKLMDAINIQTERSGRERLNGETNKQTVSNVVHNKTV